MTDNDADAERAERIRLAESALSQGQSALAAGDKVGAMKWLDRARRLAPDDLTIRLMLAAAAIGDDNAMSAELFSGILSETGSWDALIGHASVRLLMGQPEDARAALHEALSQYVIRTDVRGLAERIARATGAAGWCGVTSKGTVLVETTDGRSTATMLDGRRIDTHLLPPSWPGRRWVTVKADQQHLIGSPISLRAIGKVVGNVKADRDGISGWAWSPGNPEIDPRLRVETPRGFIDIVASTPAAGIAGAPPFARPRAFSVAYDRLPADDAVIHVRGSDGRDLSGSPISRSSDHFRRSTEHSPAKRRRINRRQWLDDSREAVILITHDDGGGVERRVQAAIASHEARGRRVIVMRPGRPPDGTVVVSSNSAVLRFELPREQNALLGLLRDVAPLELELHHFLDHDPSILEIVRILAIPYDIHVHDYVWFCPRIALVGGNKRYCGEPAIATCEACVANHGGYLRDGISVTALRERSRKVLAGARRVIAPSRDTAARMSRHFDGIAPTIIPHDDDDAIAESSPVARDGIGVLVCVVGGIGLHKGYHVLLACARDAAERDLNLRFVVVGSTIDDQSLLDTGRVFVTGPYQPREVVGLIRRQGALLALLPSIWPETWCLGLSELWRAGLRVVAFDIGAPAERIRRTGRGLLLPLGTKPAVINDELVEAARGTSSLPIRGSSAYKPPTNATVSK